MRIILAANRYVPRGRATQGFLSYLTRVSGALAGFGNEVIIVACGKYPRHFREENIEIYIEEVHDGTFSCKPYGYLRNYLRMSRAVNKRIKAICREKKADIIQFTSLSALSLCYFGKAPAVMRLSSYARTAYQTHQTLRVSEERMLSFLERTAARRCSAVFAPCRNTARAFAKDTGRAVSVIESPFYNDVGEYDDSVYRENLDGKRYALFFGRLYAEKGILVIADIIHAFLEQNGAYDVVFCGETTAIGGVDARKILKRRAGALAGRLIFLDALPHRSLYCLIKEAEFVILPSLMENLSNACIEAMYFEKVVIGTDGASFEQLITDGENGLLCRINDAQSLLEKMNEAASMDDARRKAMGALARRRTDRLHPDVAVRRLLRYYQYVIDHVR